MTPTAEDIIRKIGEAYRDENMTPEFRTATSRTAMPIIIRQGDEPWLFEGFIQFFMCLRDIVAAVDLTFPPGLPPHLLNPQTISWFFGIPLEEFNVQATYPKAGSAEERLARIEAGVEQMVRSKAPLLTDGRTPPSIPLTDTEATLIEALGDKTLTALEIAKLAGYNEGSYVRGLLSSLRKRGILDNRGSGYFRVGQSP